MDSYKISNEIGYFNQIAKNIMEINKKEVENLCNNLKECDCLIPYGSGRSFCAVKIAASELAKTDNKKTILTPEDPGFPGSDMYDAAAKLEERYKKICLLINSGSGETHTPLEFAKQLSDYIEKTGSDKFTINVLSSYPDSSIARLGKKYGSFLQIKGREKSEIIVFYEEGIMGDVFELGSLFTLHSIEEIIHIKNNFFRAFLNTVKKELPRIGKLVDSVVSSDAYQFMINKCEQRNHICLGGTGSGREVAEMTARRLDHVKKRLGENVYISRGINTPRPRTGDLEILISFSGEEKEILNWCENVKSSGGNVVSLIGKEGSSLEDKSDFSIILKSDEKDKPNKFFMDATFVLSSLPVKVLKRLEDRGLKMTEEELRWVHTVTE